MNGQPMHDKSMGGVKINETVRADPTRLDMVNLETWGRVEWLPVGFYEVGGSTVFPLTERSLIHH